MPYNNLKQLNAYYLKLGKGKWRAFHPYQRCRNAGSAVAGHTTCQGYQAAESRMPSTATTISSRWLTFTGDIIAKNAYEWSEAYRGACLPRLSRLAEKIQLKPLLGHSSKAVKLPKGASLSYDFYSDKSGDARFTIAVIPCFLQHCKGYEGECEHRPCANR